MKKTLVVAAVCAFAFGATALLPADLSPIGSVYAGGNGGGGGGGGGNGGGHGGGGNGSGHGGGNSAGHSGDNGGGDGDGNGHGNGKGKGALGHTSAPSDGSSGIRGAKRNGKVEGVEHAGKSTRDHGVSGKHSGTTRNDSKGHGATTASVAHSKDTRGLSKATAISDTTPGTHNIKGLDNAADSSSKNDR
ncbi:MULTISPECIES: hypothetical protein [unclassified Pseudomonas]|uniref:hypothetical protein n=1 Tax=unclassified Pseudomonas TaxID=196821 RepID=UPI001C48E10E|nr:MULTISPECIES: hypothetical protein [unclassified Pseudomonas]